MPNSFPDYNCYKNPLKVLFTNNHILKQQDIDSSKKIDLSINDEKEQYIVYIKENRISNTFEKPDDVTFIEIKKLIKYL